MNLSKVKSDDEIYVENSKTVRSVIRRRVIRDNLIPYECSICNSPPSWREKPMSLVLDHENGINNDHRLENLRFLCPNCNHQQPTYAGKNKRKAKQNKCIDCGNNIIKTSIRCNSCSAKLKHRDGLMRYSKE